MTDEDIYAFRPVPEAAAPAAPPRRRPLWPWLLGAFALLALLVTAACGVALWSIADAAQQGLHLSVNGDDWEPLIVGADHGALALLGLGIATVVVVVVVPVALLLALLAGVLGVGLALLAVVGCVGLVAAVVLSPLWLLGLLLWLLLRRRAPARMAA